VKKLALTLLLVLGAGLTTIGCGDGRSTSRFASQQQPQPTGPGAVGQATGDPDDEVSATLQQQVAACLALGPTDAPLDF
jgi:hypothetical protein